MKANKKGMLLGQKVEASKGYSPEVLFRIERKTDSRRLQKRFKVCGFDWWTCWELYWLNLKGEPQVDVLQFRVPCDSPFIVESKSLKLYLNGLNYEKFSSLRSLTECVQTDLQDCLQSDIVCQLRGMQVTRSEPLGERLLIGDLRVSGSCKNYWDPCFRSLCPVTGQPDFATIYVENFQGSVEWLKSYWQSFANHQGFHEQCLEEIFLTCQASQESPLKLGAAFLRRGGIDIHPIRYAEGFPSDALTSLTDKPLSTFRQ